jgi:hypothetical protein
VEAQNVRKKGASENFCAHHIATLNKAGRNVKKYGATGMIITKSVT